MYILLPKYNPQDIIGKVYIFRCKIHLYLVSHFLFQYHKKIDLNSNISDLTTISKYVIRFQVNDLYLMMGRELELIDQVQAGKHF